MTATEAKLRMKFTANVPPLPPDAQNKFWVTACKVGGDDLLATLEAYAKILAAWAIIYTDVLMTAEAGDIRRTVAWETANDQTSR